MIQPASIRAGDTLKFKKSLPDYPASDGWALNYLLVNASKRLDKSASADGDDHLVTLSASETAGLPAGGYQYAIRVSKGGEVYTLETGRVEVKPDFKTATDHRSHARKMLALIEAALEGSATREQLDTLESAHRDKSWRTDKTKLLAMRDRYRTEVNRERNIERMEKGLGSSNHLQARF